MNDARRKQINKALGLLEEAQAILDAAADEEREYYDNMPESLQQGEKGDKASSAADTLEEARDTLDDMIGNLPETVG